MGDVMTKTLQHDTRSTQKAYGKGSAELGGEVE